MAEGTEAFRATVFALDGDLEALLALVNAQPIDPNEILFTIYDLLAKDHQLTEGRMRSAYILSMVLANSGQRHPIISIARCLGGIIYGTPEEEFAGLQELPAQMEELPAPMYDTIVHHVLHPVLMYLITLSLGQPDDRRMLQTLELLKAVVAPIRAMFDWEAPVPTLSLEGLRHQGRERARLVTLAAPPPGAPRSRRRVLMAQGQSFVPPNQWADNVDVTDRMGIALREYGWEAEAYHMDNTDRAGCCRTIAELCRERRIDILICDDNVLLEVPQARAEMIARLKRDNPEIKVVGLLMDAWTLPEDRLLEQSRLLDAIWTGDVPSRPIWQRPEFAGKTMQMPMTYQGILPEDRPWKPLNPQLFFSGRISGGNWHRAFWLAASRKWNLPIGARLSPLILNDGLTPLDSFRLYMEGLADATCGINFLMRPNHSCAVTGRTYEIIWSGALLVQEASPDTCHFLVPGEHYLEFSSIAELAAITRFLAEKPEEAEEIRRAGHAFVRERYSNLKIIGQIEKSLYYPD